MEPDIIYLTPAEIAHKLRVTPRTVQNWRYKDEPYGPPFVYIGGKVLYPVELFKQWCQVNDATASAN